MKLIYKKLHSRLGETLVETMVAILIFTLSSIILLSMVATASKLNAEAKKSDKAIASELNVAEAQIEDSGKAKQIQISYSGKSQTIDVLRFSSTDSGSLYSYSYKEPVTS